MTLDRQAAGGRRRRVTRAARDTLSRSVTRIPEPIRVEVRGVAARLRAVHSLEEASALVTTEIERLLTVVVPMFVRYPLPVGRASGRLLVGATAGGAAMLEEFEAVAALLSLGAAAPGAPAVLAADFAALATEAYVAASVRINALSRAGRPIVADELARDLARAMTGSGAPAGGDSPQDVAAGIAKRLVQRWAVGLTPLAGIAYDGWDAQRTVSAIARLPLPDPPEPPAG